MPEMSRPDKAEIFGRDAEAIASSSGKWHQMSAAKDHAVPVRSCKLNSEQIGMDAEAIASRRGLSLYKSLEYAQAVFCRF